MLSDTKSGVINPASRQNNSSLCLAGYSASLGFLRCSAFSLRPQASSTHAEKLAPGLSCFSRSTLASISSTNSYGNLIPLYAD